MFFQRHNVLYIITGCTFLSLSSISHAASNDVFLQPKPINTESPLSVEASYDVVNDTVDIFNLRSRQGPVAENAGDYQGGHLALSYALHPQWLAELDYWNRNIEYGQDTNRIDSWLAAAEYQPELALRTGDEVAIRFSLWGDRANKLTKTSATSVNNLTLSHIEVNDLQDIQGQVDLLFSRRLDRQNKLNGFISGGYGKVDVDHLSATLNSQGCNYNIHVNSNNQLSSQLAVAPCTTTGGTTLYEASLTGQASDYGLDMDKDLSYDAGFISIGGSWNWRYKKFESQLGYQYQYLMRQDIDDRVGNYGNSAIKSNQTLGLDLSYKLNNNVSVFMQGQAFKNNFIGTIPFLYNSVTASRLNRNYGYASFGVRFANF